VGCNAMKFHLAYPSGGTQKLVEIDDDQKLRAFYDKRISHEVEGDVLGDDFKGYIFKISGGNDQQGFPMKQGVLTSSRVRLLMSKGASCYRPRKRGERKRKSVRGCIVSQDMSVINLVIVKKGPKDIPGLTDKQNPRMRGPKRATKIRKLFNASGDEDVRTLVGLLKRQVTPKSGKKPYTKRPKIQRLITPERLQHKRQRKGIKVARYTKSKEEAEVYTKLLNLRLQEQKQKRAVKLASKRSVSRKESDKPATATKVAKPVAVAKTTAPAKPVAVAKTAAPAAKPAAKPAAVAKPAAKVAAVVKPAAKVADKPKPKPAAKPARN